MVARRKHRTGFLGRVAQALTGHDSDHVAAQGARLENAIKDLKKQVEAGKISQEELELQLTLLKGEAYGEAG